MVHRADQDGVKGVYYLNMGSGFGQFPFQVKGFHSDNGSEFINYQVAAVLQKLFIEQIKSRRRRSNDNALVESKNGAVVRKHMG